MSTFRIDTASKTLAQIMREEGCNEWQPTSGSGAIIRCRCADGGSAYARLVRRDELTETR